eukprot:GFYU01000140.1.p1 GENE.GFYU01000140.1~~GFYU01000140.1.p1  ORF type:complete len:410 (+),score=94.51 GFYU01000140.1:165-1232(+)
MTISKGKGLDYIDNKSRRHVTFSKRKSGLMKKAHELSVLTGHEVLVLVASKSGRLHTFASHGISTLVTEPSGKSLIQKCLAGEVQGDDNVEGTSVQVAMNMSKNALAQRPFKSAELTLDMDQEPVAMEQDDALAHRSPVGDCDSDYCSEDMTDPNVSPMESPLVETPGNNSSAGFGFHCRGDDTPDCTGSDDEDRTFADNDRVRSILSRLLGAEEADEPEEYDNVDDCDGVEYTEAEAEAEYHVESPGEYEPEEEDLENVVPRTPSYYGASTPTTGYWTPEHSQLVDRIAQEGAQVAAQAAAALLKTSQHYVVDEELLPAPVHEHVVEALPEPVANAATGMFPEFDCFDSMFPVY